MGVTALDNLLLHSKTRTSALSYIEHPVHALMIVGDTGSGKNRVARAVGAALLDVSSAALDRHPYFMRISKPDNKSETPIETVRTMLKKMTLKSHGAATIRRVVHIEGAHLLSEEAQNAVLKILEEPAADTVFILTALSRQSVLPTIASRTLVIPVHNVSKKDAINYYRPNHEVQAVQNAWHLSSGNVRLMESILSDAETPLKKSVDEAKHFLSGDIYQRLVMIDDVSKDRQRLDLLLSALEKVLEALQRSPNNQGKANAAKLLKNRKLVSELNRARLANTNARLIMLELTLNLKL